MASTKVKVKKVSIVAASPGKNQKKILKKNNFNYNHNYPAKNYKKISR